ncbi:MAG: PAS domain S-box protein [Deltaproteobacteria bacterium]|nr:MAG: PAS domain S-box protein [Deltaproteobacteria bacterium]
MMVYRDKSKEELAKDLNELLEMLRNIELERYELEKTLGESLRRYRAIVEDQTELICRFRPDFKLTFVNEAYCRFFNKKREDLLGFSFMPLIPPEDTKKVRAHFDSLGPENPVATHEHQVIAPNGEIRWQQWTNRAIFDDEDRIIEFQSVGRDNTDRKRAEVALQQSEERFRSLVENSTDWFWAVDENAVYTYSSPKIRDLLGYEAEEVLGKTPFSLMPPDEADRVADIFASYAKSRRPFKLLENTNVHKDGHLVVLETSGIPIFDAEGVFLGYRGIDRDITERKQAEEELRRAHADMEKKVEERTRDLLEVNEQLRREIKNRKREKIRRRESEAYMEAILNAAPVGIGLVKNRVLVWVSHRMTEMLGYSVDELVGKSARIAYESEEEFDRVGRVKYQEINERGIGLVETRFKSKKGSVIDVLLCSSALDHGDLSRGVIFTVRDITEQKRAEQALRESEEKYRKLVETSIDGIAIVQGTEVKFANQALLNMYGVSKAEEVVGHNFTEFVSHQHRDLLLQRGLDRESGKGAPNRYEFKALRQDGTEFDAEISVNPISHQGKPARQAFLRDVTARKRGERYLRESEQKYRLLVENLPSIVYKGYKDWSVDFVDEKIEALTGYSMKEFNSRKMKWSDLIVKEDLAGVRESFIKALKNDKSYTREYRIKTKWAHILWIHERAMILCDQKGEIDYVSGVFFDVTEQKKAQEALRKREAELAEQSRHLEEVNAALKVLLKRREEDKNDLEEKVLANVKELVLPYVEKLKNSRLRSDQMTLVGILESNMQEISSPFVTKLSSRFLGLTPAEIQVASLIKDGKTSKEIATLLHTSENTIRSHRFHIRSKLDLKNKKVNLRSYLRSLQ